MESNERNKRDLPEVVADILIEQHAIRQTLEQMQKQMQQQHEQTMHAFNTMTNAVLNAMDRQTDRYQQTNTDVVDLARRVEALEKQVFNKAG